MKIKIFILVSLVVLAGMGWWYTRERKMVVFCDVGQGDGVIVIDGDWEMIIDAGPDNGKMGECLGKYLPFWDKEIEVAVISHWDSDHSGGLKGIQQLYRIKETYGGSPPNPGNEQVNYTSNLKDGDAIRTEEMQFEVKLPSVIMGLETSQSNERSLVSVMNYGIYEILFTGDITAEEERMMVWRRILDTQTIRQSDDQKTRILKVSHHGSREGTTKELVEGWQPKVAVISVGKDNRFGHPTEEVLARLTAVGIKIRRTDKEGDIVIKYSND